MRTQEAAKSPASCSDAILRRAGGIAVALESTAGEIDEGAAFVFLGKSRGRPVLARQRRGDASGVAVQPWGASESNDAFTVEITASHPDGTGRVKAEVEACPEGAPFGDASCTSQISPTWLAVDGTTPDVVISETLSGLTAFTLHLWRARVLYASSSVTEPGIAPPAKPSHGPWRRLGAQAREADILVPEPSAPWLLLAGTGLLLGLRRLRAGSFI